MATFEVAYSYLMPDGGVNIIEAESSDQADYMTQNFVQDTYPDAVSITIDEIKEIGL